MLAWAKLAAPVLISHDKQGLCTSRGLAAAGHCLACCSTGWEIG